VATIAIGDIHGNADALTDVLDQVILDLTTEDVVVFLGDYIDRGPSSKSCIDRILDFRSHSPAKVITLLGNHEEWLLRTLRDSSRHSWLLGMEAFATIASYSPDAAIELRRSAEAAGTALLTADTTLPYEIFFSHVPQTHISFLKSLVPCHQTEDAICVHGGVDPDIADLDQQPVSVLVWGIADFMDRYDGRSSVVYGHWDNAVLDAAGWPWPRFGKRTVGIDTISHGVLTALCLPGGTVVQSRRHSI